MLTVSPPTIEDPRISAAENRRNGRSSNEQPSSSAILALQEGLEKAIKVNGGKIPTGATIFVTYTPPR